MAAPLERYRVLATTHLDEARDKVSRYFWPHRIDVAGRKAALAASFHHAPVAASSLNYVRYGADTLIDAGEQPDCYMFKYAVDGPLGAARRDTDYQVRPGQLIVSAPARDLKVRFARKTGLLIFKVPRRRLNRHLTRMLGDTVAGRTAFRDGPVTATGAMQSYVRALTLLRLELDASQSLARNPAAAVEYEEFLLSALLRAWPHSQSHRLDAPPAIRPYAVKRVIDYIEANADRPLRAGDLVRVSGAGTSALYAAFQRHVGCSPMAYLRGVRLSRARAALLAAGEAETVSSIALDWGFSHFGRFGAAYREAFGETPSETLRRSRR